MPSVAGIHNAIASILSNGGRDSFEFGARKRSAIFVRARETIVCGFYGTKPDTQDPAGLLKQLRHVVVWRLTKTSLDQLGR